jgi:spermidine/putrescine transport system substrate-binding protein
MDNAVLLKDAPNRANALKFMNFLLQPENAAALMARTSRQGQAEGSASGKMVFARSE